MDSRINGEVPKFDSDGLPIPSQKVQFDEDGLPIPVKKKDGGVSPIKSNVSSPSQSVSNPQSTSQGNSQPVQPQQQPTKPQPFDPATFMRQSRAVDDFSSQNPIDLAKQSDELSKKTVPVSGGNVGVGSGAVSLAPDAASVEKSKKINDYLTKNGYDADKLNKLFSDFPDEYYTALGVTKEQMAQNLKDNPVKTEQQIASAKWQIPVQQNILNTQGQQGLIDFQNMRNVFADNETDYATKRKLAPQLLQAIRLNTPAGEMSKIQANFANDAAQAYGDVQDTDPTLIAEQKQYPNLNLNQVRALDYLKDVSPDKAQGFAAALVDPSKIKDNYDAQVGQQEKLKRLDEIGISLKENSLNEQFAPLKKTYDELYTLKQNGAITPEQDAQLQEVESVGAPIYQQLQDLKNQKNDLLVKYPAAGVNDAGLFAQELLGQKHTGLNWLALETGQATSGAANSVWDLVSEPFRSDENSKIHQLSTLGDSKISQASTNLTQGNQVSQSFTPTLSPDLQQYVDQLKPDKTLTDNQKSDLLTKKLMQNPDQWQRTPIEGGKTNIGITSMLYGTGQLAATLAPYVLAETATGGGASAGFARKFTSSFASMLGTSFHDAYAQAIDNGESDPYGYALRTTAINSAAMAGAGTPEAIRDMLKGKSAVGDLVGKMTDDEILGALRKEPKEMSLFRKSVGIVKNAGKAVAESGVEGIKSAAKISPFITGGQMLNDVIDDNAKNPQDYAKQAAIEGLKFAVLGTALGTVGKIGATDVNKAAIYQAGQDPKGFLDALQQKEDNGSITPQDAQQVRDNIAKAQQVFKKVPFVDAKGNPLSENDRRNLLFLKMQENDLQDNLSKDLPESLQNKMQERLVGVQGKIDDLYKGTLLDEVPKKPTNKLTPEATYYLQSVDKGTLPKRMTDNLATIAKDNGIPTPEGTTVKDVIDALKVKAAKGRVEDFEKSINPETTPDLLQKLKTDPNVALDELINHHTEQMQGTNLSTKDYSQKAIDKFKGLKEDYNLINQKPEENNLDDVVSEKPAEPVSSPVISDKENETQTPAEEQQQPSSSKPTNTEENNSTNKQEAVPSTTDLEGFGGRGGRNRLYERVKNLDEPADIDGKILHYFAGGGKVHPESFSKEVVGMKRKGYGDKEGSYPSEVKGNTLVKATDENGKPNPTIKQLSESFGDGTNDQEIRNKIIDVLQSHGSRESAATELINKYDQEYIEAKHQKEENDYWEGIHKQEVEAEQNYLTEKGGEQDEIEQSPEYIKYLIKQYETETVPVNDKQPDTGSKTESSEARSTPKDTQPEGADKSERPSDLRGSSEDKPEPDKSQPETSKGEIKEQPVDPAHPDYKPLDFTAIKNDVVNSEREAQGKEPIKSSGDGTMTRAEQTKAKIESGEISEEHIRDLTQAIATGDKDFVTNLKPDEIQHVLMYDRQTLQNKRSQIESELIGAKETKNDAAVERLLVKQAQNDLLLEANDKADNKTGREWSDAGRARQLIIRKDYSFEALKRRAKAASKDGVLDKASEDRLRELSKLVEQKDAQLLEKNEAIAAADREIAELKKLNNAAKNRKSEVSAFDDLKKETKTQIRQQGKRTIEKIKFERENIKASLKSKWKNHIHGGNMGVNNLIPLDMVPDLIKLAKSYIEEGLAVGKEAVLEHIVDRVHKDVVEAIGDVDKTTVRDAITGYGKIKKPNTDPIDTAFRDIAAQGRLVSSIELAEKGEPPLKSGQQRDKPSAEQRRLQKELNKAVKDNNIQVKSPEEQLKTSLDAAKTRLKNQIEDLSDAIDRNEKIVKDRKGLEYDQEAKDLKAQRDELRDEYDKIFGTDKELTTEERIERASNAVKKSIDKLNERITNKDFSQNKRVDLKSPELDALKKQREDLQKVYKDLMDAEGETNRRKLEALKKNIAKRTAYLNEIKNTGNLDKFIADRTKKKTVLDAEATRMKAEQQKVKNDVDNMIRAREFQNMSSFQKGLHWAGRFSKGVLISNPAVLMRIVGSVIGRATMKAPTASITYGLSKILPRLAKGAHTEAITSAKDLAGHLATYYSTLFSKENFEGMKFAFKHHNTAEDLTLGRNYHKLPIPDIKVTNLKTAIQASFFNTLKVLDKNASLHGAGKSLASLPEYRAYQKTIAVNLIREGITAEELGQPTLQEAINQLAFRKSLRAKFMQENTVTGMQGTLEEYFRRKKMPELAEVLNGILPITKISSNYISEALTKIPFVGNLAAYKPISKILAHAFGDPKLSEQEKSILLRTLTYQGVGALTYALGWALHGSFNPFYKSSANKFAQKKNPDEEDNSLLVLFETLSHFPDALVFNAGVSHAWVWDKYDEEHPGEKSMATFMGSMPDAIMENSRNIASSSPYLSTGNTVLNPLITGKGTGKAAANFVKSRIPFSTTLSEVAQGKIPVLNKLGIKSGHEEEVKPYEVGIYPKSFMDNIAIGVPGWRQEVLQRLYDEKHSPKPKKTNEEKHDAKVRAHEKKVKDMEFKEQLAE